MLYKFSLTVNQPSACFGKEIQPYKPILDKFADDLRQIFNVVIPMTIPEPMEKLSHILKLAEDKTFGEFSKALWECVKNPVALL